MRVTTRATVLFLLPLLVIGLIACGSDDSSVADQAEMVGDVQTGVASDATDEDGEGHIEAVVDEHDDGEGDTGEAGGGPLATGAELFVEKGCSACHGADGIGTDFAPAMPGHTELQVRRQVRGPIGIMSVFGPEVISSAELDALVDYVTSLSGGHAHGGGGADPTSDELLGHHLMAITALEGDNTTEAQHHIEHILGIVEGEHLVLMQRADELASNGETHDAQHLIEAMVADVTTLDEDLGTLHLKLALSSLRVGDTDGAGHHLDHSLGSGEILDSSEVLEILGLIDSTNLAEAEGHLSELVGVDAIGVEAVHDDAEAAHEDAAEAVHDDAEAAHDDAEAAHDDAAEAVHDDAEAAHDDAEAAHEDAAEAVHDDAEAAHDDAETAHDDDEAVQDNDEAVQDEAVHDDAEAENDDDHHDDDASDA